MGKKNPPIYHHKSVFFKDADIEKILVFNKICSGEKSYKYVRPALYENFLACLI